MIITLGSGGVDEVSGVMVQRGAMVRILAKVLMSYLLMLRQRHVLIGMHLMRHVGMMTLLHMLLLLLLHSLLAQMRRWRWLLLLELACRRTRRDRVCAILVWR